MIRNVTAVLVLVGAISLGCLPMQAIPHEAVEIEMRDGEVLAADIYPGDTRTEPKPVILVQTPYNRTLYRPVMNLQRPDRITALPVDTASFHYVVVDWRGFYGSRDAAKAGYDRGLDGVDVIAWIREQPWCDGQVGTWGGSALGDIQFRTAKHRPEGLVCIVPMIKEIDIDYENYYYGGVLRESHVQALQTLGFTTVETITSRPTRDIVWQTIEAGNTTPDSIAVPTLMITGWFDHYPTQIIDDFEKLRARSDVAVRGDHRLIVGPWTHSGLSNPVQGELEYPEASSTMIEASLDFLRHHLLGTENGWTATPTVRFFRLGSNRWEIAGGWQDAVRSTVDRSFWLTSSGLLTTTEPTTSDVVGTYPTDPRDPSPTHGGSLFEPLVPNSPTGPHDQREVVESRPDAITFTTAPFTSDLRVIGPIRIELFVDVDVLDADIAVRLTDVYPDGRSMLLTQGIQRLRFRDGYAPSDTSLVEPGTVVPVTVELEYLATTFRAGHAMRIVLTGTNWPHFAINPQTGGVLYQPGDTVVSRTRVHGGGEMASRVIVPIEQSMSVGGESDVWWRLGLW